MRDWTAFWDSPHSIYVNARHRDVHYRDIAEQIAGFVESKQARVLDYGSGEAVHADRVAAAAGELYLCDAAPTTRAALSRRFAGDPRIKVIAPDDAERLADASFDLVVVNSVIQYIEPAELGRLLNLCRRIVKPDGKFILADVIPPGVGPASDVAALLTYAARNGFLSAALIGVVRTAFSSYRKLRASLGVSRYTQADIEARLNAAGFRAERLAKNLEHNPARMTFLARPSLAAESGLNSGPPRRSS